MKWAPPSRVKRSTCSLLCDVRMCKTSYLLNQFIVFVVWYSLLSMWLRFVHFNPDDDLKPMIESVFCCVVLRFPVKNEWKRRTMIATTTTTTKRFRFDSWNKEIRMCNEHEHDFSKHFKRYILCEDPDEYIREHWESERVGILRKRRWQKATNNSKRETEITEKNTATKDTKIALNLLYHPHPSACNNNIMIITCTTFKMRWICLHL